MYFEIALLKRNCYSRNSN